MNARTTNCREGKPSPKRILCVLFFLWLPAVSRLLRAVWPQNPLDVTLIFIKTYAYANHLCKLRASFLATSR